MLWVATSIRYCPFLPLPFISPAIKSLCIEVGYADRSFRFPPLSGYTVPELLVFTTVRNPNYRLLTHNSSLYLWLVMCPPIAGWQITHTETFTLGLSITACAYSPFNRSLSDHSLRSQLFSNVACSDRIRGGYRLVPFLHNGAAHSPFGFLQSMRVYRSRDFPLPAARLTARSVLILLLRLLTSFSFSTVTLSNLTAWRDL
jgi:hypothetical protein